MKFTRKKRRLGQLEITPLIDVVLLLLIFFVISSTFVTAPGIKVKLPLSSSQTTMKEDRDIVVVVTVDGQLYIDNQAVDIDELNSNLQTKMSDGKDHLLIVKADKESKHGRVVEVMDLAKRLGISRLAIATKLTEKK